MKKRTLACIIGLAVTVTSNFGNFGQGFSNLWVEDWKMPLATAFAEETTTEETTTEETIDVADLKEEDLIDWNELYGWATMPGAGRYETTGGKGGEIVVVTDQYQFMDAVFDNKPRIVVVAADLQYTSNDERGFAIGSNKTIVGINENITIDGGIYITQKENIVISNLNFKGSWNGSGSVDAITVTNSHHIWFNHLNIWDSRDGNLDMTAGSDYITVSWCKFWYTSENNNHRLSCLVSSGADNGETDRDKFHVTYHHNWFAENVEERMPRVLFGRAHIYNNYYTAKDCTYCIGVGTYASALIENNYFKEVTNPYISLYTYADPTNITARGNELVNIEGYFEEGFLGSAYGYVEAFSNAPYEYYLDEGKEVPAIVEANAGPQNILTEATPAPSKDSEKIVKPTEATPTEKPTPMPEPTPVPTPVYDNPVTYDQETDTYTYHGQNQDGSNGGYIIDNPFANYQEKTGNKLYNASIAYWVYLPREVEDAPVLNFNLSNYRQMNFKDAEKYQMNQYFAEDLSLCILGESNIYVDENGREYQVLTNPGEMVQYNPEYPKSGCYIADKKGTIYVYPQGADPLVKENWITVSWLGEGQWDYGKRFDEEGGENSKISEAYTNGSLSLYASCSVGFGQDDVTGVEINPNLPGFGHTVNVMKENMYCFWGNGSDFEKVLNSSRAKYPPTVEEKGTWHYVVASITRYGVNFFVDGKQMTEEYLNYWGNSIYSGGVEGDAFYTRTGVSMLDMLTNPTTILTVGGDGSAAKVIGQDNIKTPEGVKVKNIAFYDVYIYDDFIKADGIVPEYDWGDGYVTKIEPISGIHSVPTEPEPTPEPTETPIPTATPTPEPAGLLGDVNRNGEITAEDALLTLKHVVKLETLSEEQILLADVNVDNQVSANDALHILQYVVKLIDSFENIGTEK